MLAHSIAFEHAPHHTALHRVRSTTFEHAHSPAHDHVYNTAFEPAHSTVSLAPLPVFEW